MKLVQGLAATIAVDGDIDQARYERLCAQIFKEQSQLRNIAGAPDLIIRLIYPVAPNLASVGFDYRTSDQQREAALKVRDTRTTLLTGPVKLTQGGTGLIARYPVFKQDGNGGEAFWGIISAVMDLEKLYSDSGLDAPGLPIDIAISHKSPSTQGEVFFGDPGLFARSPVTLPIDLGYDVWQLAAVPKGGWDSSQPGLAVSRLYSIIVALFVVGPLVWAGYLMRQRYGNILALQEREDRLETLSQRLQLALVASKIGVWEFDQSTDELIWDGRMRELYSVAADKTECSYSDWSGALHPDDLAEAEAAFAQALQDEVSYITEFRVVAPDGEVRHIKAYGMIYWTSAGSKRIVGANWDVTDDVLLHNELRDAHVYAEVQNRQLEDASKTLAYQSVHDSLTGLPNRRYLDQYMEQHAQTEHLSFLHVDLDRFKHVNDTLGHAAGDEVLKVAAARLLNELGAAEFVARIGGDEFVIACPTASSQERSRVLAAAIVTAFADPVVIGENDCQVGASVGVASRTTLDQRTDQLLVNADFALYEAKKNGRNRVEFFTEDLRLTTLNTKKTADEVVRGLEHSEFIPYFQPQFDATTLAVVGVEALARWQHPTRGLLTPDQFLDVAQSLNRVADLDAIILEKSLFQHARWTANDVHVPKVSVNISAQRLADESLLQRLSELSIPRGSLSFELLESISFDGHDAHLMGAIQRIKAFGIDIEIDDFGTGHASIVSLLELAPRRLKIDRKLVAPIVSSYPEQRLVASIIDIGRSLGIEIIAEGVETMAHAELLRDLGCHTLQGYAFARPMSSRDLQEFMQSWRKSTSRHAPRVA